MQEAGAPCGKDDGDGKVGGAQSSDLLDIFGSDLLNPPTPRDAVEATAREDLAPGAQQDVTRDPGSGVASMGDASDPLDGLL